MRKVLYTAHSYLLPSVPWDAITERVHSLRSKNGLMQGALQVPLLHTTASFVLAGHALSQTNEAQMQLRT